jgi:tetratricopeptide (TPR) repeat protein
MRDDGAVGRNSLSVSLLAVCLTAGAQDAAFRQGSELYRAGNCSEALRQLGQSKGTPRASLLMGRCYLEMADYVKARASLQQYTQAVPGDEEATILLARASDAGVAVAALTELQKQSPGSLAVQDALAEAYARSAKPAEATELYNAVLTVQPSDIGAVAGLAGLAAAASQWAAAAEQYKKVLELSPDDAAAVLGMGQTQLQLGNMAAAVPYLQHAARLRPDDWALSKILANCYIKTEKWPETIRALEYNSLTHPDDVEVTAWVVQAFGHTGDTVHAERYYRAVLQRAAGNFPARMTLANLLYEGKRTKDAKEQYILILKAKPELVEISDRVGQIAEQEDNLPQAIQYYSEACRSPQSTPAMKLRLARAYFRTGDVANGRPALENILRGEPDNREVKTMLFQVAVKTKKTEDAVRYAAELLPGDPKNMEFLRLLADEALKQNNDAAAADYLERAIAADGRDRESRFELVGIYTNNEKLDRLARALDLMNEYVGLNPDDYEGYLLLANLYRRKSDAAEAHTYFARGFAKMPAKPPARMSWAYTSLGLLLFSEGNYEEALSIQLKAVELNPTDANAEYNLALTYLKVKRRDEVNAARTKLSQMSAPELVSALDEAIQRSRINQEK